MNIPNPIANYGEHVLVLNYRCRPNVVWEEGIIQGLSFKNNSGDFWWSYDITLVRRNPKGNAIWLRCDTKGIKLYDK